MPKLSLNPQSAAGLLVRDGLPMTAGIPSLADYAANLRGVPAAGSQWTQWVSVENGRLQGLSTQATLGAMASNVGIPVMDVFKSLTAAMGVDISAVISEALEDAAELVQKAVQEAIAGAFEAMETTIIAVASSIPVYGYIVDLIWKLVTAIRSIVALAKSAPPAAKEYDPPYYDRLGDIQMFNDALAKLRGTYDWTEIWEPPTLGESAGHGGARFGASNIVGADNWLVTGLMATGAPGCVPGSGWLHQSLLFTSYGTVSEMGGVVYPSLRQQSAVLWSALARNNVNPGLYCVDAGRIRDQWAQYLEHLWLFLRGKGNEQFRTATNWGTEFVGTDKNPGPFHGMDLTRDPTDALISNTRIVRSADLLLTRQKELLDSPLIAYLETDMVAFDVVPGLRQKWFDRRKQLLTHPARCNVSLADVSDTIYYDYLVKSGVGSPKCSPAHQIAAKGFAADKHVPKGDNNFGGITMAAPAKKKGIPVVPIAAAAAVVYFIPKIFPKLLPK